MTVQELESRMTGTEYQRWLAYERHESFGSVRDDWRAAYMLAVIANMIRGKNTQPLTPMDFAPDSVLTWYDAITAAGEERGNIVDATDKPIPKSRNMMIFDDMMRDHMKG